MPGPVWMLGSGGRTPFVGHFRGARTCGAVELAWAGRIAGTAGVAEGWAASESARDALSEILPSGDPSAVLAAACGALTRIDPRWLARRDMTVLLVATRGAEARAAGSGLGGVWAPDGAGWRALLPKGHPARGEPGLPSGESWPIQMAERWVGATPGQSLPTGDLAPACGVHP